MDGRIAGVRSDRAVWTFHRNSLQRYRCTGDVHLTKLIVRLACLEAYSSCGPRQFVWAAAALKHLGSISGKQTGVLIKRLASMGWTDGSGKHVPEELPRDVRGTLAESDFRTQM